MTLKKFFLFSLILLCLPAHSYGQLWSGILDPSRAIDWAANQPGVVGGIPNRTAICATLNPGSTAAQINAAIASCPAGQVVFLNAGTYTLTTGIIFNNKNNVTLRGAGPHLTFLVFSGGNNCGGLGGDVCFQNGHLNWAGAPGNTANWTAGYAKGTTSITLSSVTNLQVGSLLILDQINDASDPGTVWVCADGSCSNQGTSGNGRPGTSGPCSTCRNQTQVVRVTSISGSAPNFSVGITPGLHMPNWRASQNPGAWWSSSLPISGSGIENLSMDHTGTPSGISSGVFIYNGYNIWLKAVRSLTPRHKHVWMYQSAHITVRDSYFYGVAQGASDSYGTDTWVTSDALVENNIFQHVTVPMMNEGSSGSVYGYNYATDDFYFVATWQMNSSWHHAVGNSFILWEGNDGTGLSCDLIHGTAHFVTAFRNFWFGLEPGKTDQTIPVHLYSFCRYFNFVSNVLGHPTYHTNYQSVSPSGINGKTSIFTLGWSGHGGTTGTHPNDPLTHTTLLRWGNYDTVTDTARFLASEVPSGLSQYANPVPGNQALPNSMYLSGRPSWFGAVPWPPIGPDITGGIIPGGAGHAHKIPARLCYENTLKVGGILTFNADTCYPGTLTVPNPPTSLHVQ